LVVTITGPDMLLTRAEAAEVARVSVERIRTWERREHLERAGLNEDGQPVYKAVDVAKAQYKLRGFTRIAA
jgi:DNA-binding transcriptional MerR regulator